MILRRSLLLGAATLGTAATHPAAAEAFPQRPIRLVVPLGTGGATDIVARLLAERVGAILGQPMIVVNRPGAGGTIGSDVVAKAEPDGYTILMGTIGTVAIAPALYRSLPYDPDAAFAPVILASTSQFVLAARTGLEANDVAGLVALARARPGALNFGSAGIGSTLHLGMELLAGLADIRLTHVPYRSSGQVATALIQGEVDVGLPDMAAAMPHLREGKIKALAVTGRRRAAALPDVRTVVEQGFADFDVSVWLGILAPAGTPAPVVARLHAAFAEALRLPRIIERLTAIDADVAASTPEEFAAHIRTERRRWAEVVQRSGVTIQ